MKTQPTWADLAEIVLKGVQELAVGRADMPPDVPEWIAQSPLSLHERADRACAAFAQG